MGKVSNFEPRVIVVAVVADSEGFELHYACCSAGNYFALSAKQGRRDHGFCYGFVYCGGGDADADDVVNYFKY